MLYFNTSYGKIISIKKSLPINIGYIYKLFVISPCGVCLRGSWSVLGCDVTGINAWRIAFSQTRACSKPTPLSAETMMFSFSRPHVGSSPTWYVIELVTMSNTWGFLLLSSVLPTLALSIRMMSPRAISYR